MLILYKTINGHKSIKYILKINENYRTALFFQKLF